MTAAERVAALQELAGMELEAYQLAEFTGVSRTMTRRAKRAKYRLYMVDRLRAELGCGDSK